jgi:hypothetical protein
MVTVLAAAVIGALCSFGVIGIVKDLKNNKKK